MIRIMCKVSHISILSTRGSILCWFWFVLRVISPRFERHDFVLFGDLSFRAFSNLLCLDTRSSSAVSACALRRSSAPAVSLPREL